MLAVSMVMRRSRSIELVMIVTSLARIPVELCITPTHRIRS